ncbi:MULTISPECIES: anthranilate phosphoribosyltransferase [unclassified Lentimicrobium]|uniref:anthranilate phosphoribosyltransferase n=1 Tax=unclassified Lentimicrobium TaxID=2677434 RepID=UPI00155204E9|nr:MULTISPECIES: anthranilate phosphoribosyltransferase [unclassified Lentimicrobium]NPD46705.1 anthranilate phosphoribosyltransferase [Lentimicrobium sp. S6]NPD85519.1 anthranilate phosphoribosyltransferase [Lentimicrobium sp. L6]
MKMILERLFQQQKLSREEAKEILGFISEGKYNTSEVSAFLTVFRMRSITVDELSGFRDGMIERCIPINLDEFNPVDLCGTGGDGKDTFNISTLSSFITAGAGLKVAKHGNYGVSSSCGSSNVMEHLGYKFTNQIDILKQQIDKSGICFLHAPLFHPSMKNVAPIRRDIGVKTFFNMLGPMVNPASPKNQMVGVYSMELQRYYKYIYEQENKNYRIVHSMDGYDEISLTAPTKVISPDKEYMLSPEIISKEKINPEDLKGGKTVAESAKIFTSILNGEGTYAQNRAVIANAAMAINAVHSEKSFEDCLNMAQESLESKKAQQALKTLISS